MTHRSSHGWNAAGAATWILVLGAAFPAGAQAPVPVGAQFQVNSYTTGEQFRLSAASDADGDFVVVWTSDGSFGTDTSDYSIQGQRYASNGSAQGAEFQVNSYTAVTQIDPSVAMDADGEFVVVWSSFHSPASDTSAFSIQGQRYASDGSPQGAQFQVNSYTTDYQVYPSVAAAADGDFVVVWESVGSAGTDASYQSIQGQRFASDGSPQGAQFQVNSYTTSYQQSPSVAADSDGDFVVVWESNGSSGTDPIGYSVQGQRYASDGSAQGAQFQVNSYTTGYQYYPSVTAHAAGAFVVVWQSSRSAGSDTSQFSIQGQRYTSNGSLQGAQFQINTYTTGFQRFPDVAAAGAGEFVVVWNSSGSNATDTSSESVHGQLYASNGAAAGDEFQINTYTTSVQWFSSVAAAGDGKFVVGWRSLGSAGSDTAGFSVQARRFRMMAALAVSALSPASRLALGAALLLLGAGYALRQRA